MRARSLLPCATLALTLGSLSLSARAQDAQTQGRALFNEGVTLFNKSDFDGACPKFEASLKAFPGIGTRGKLAECYEKQGRLASAYNQYKEVALLASKSGESAREQVATARMKALEPKLSFVTIALPPANDTPGLVVKRGGNELERSKLGTAEAVESGTISVEVSAPGKKTFATQLTAVAGQTTKFDIPMLVTQTGPLVGPVTPTPPDPAINVATDPTVHGDPPAWQKPTGIVLLGVGVVGIGVGAAVGLSAKSKYNSAFDNGSCDHTTNQCDAAGQSSVDSARSQATVSTILFAAGGALAVGGLVVFLTAPSSRARALTVSPMMTAGGGFVSLGGSL